MLISLKCIVHSVSFADFTTVRIALAAAVKLKYVKEQDIQEDRKSTCHVGKIFGSSVACLLL